MKLKKISRIGLLVAAFALSGCSKQASIGITNIYSIPMNGAAYLITEIQNTGQAGVTAFQGKWTISDELGNKVADQEIKYMSDTLYATPQAAKPSHVIAPGEKLLIVIQAISGQPDNVFATTEENLPKIGNPVFVELLKDSKLSNYKAKGKFTFELENSVTQ